MPKFLKQTIGLTIAEIWIARYGMLLVWLLSVTYPNAGNISEQFDLLFLWRRCCAGIILCLLFFGTLNVATSGFPHSNRCWQRRLGVHTTSVIFGRQLAALLGYILPVALLLSERMPLRWTEFGKLTLDLWILNLLWGCPGIFLRKLWQVVGLDALLFVSLPWLTPQTFRLLSAWNGLFWPFRMVAGIALMTNYIGLSIFARRNRTIQ
jgi:hypothetical protein